jgi:hypothetical protein
LEDKETMRIPKFLFVLPGVLAASPFAVAEEAKAVQQKLESKYKLTVINAEGVVVIQGAVLVLEKGGLTAGSMSACANDYKEGRIGLASVSKATCNSTPGKLSRIPFGGRVPGLGSASGAAQPVRPFVMGEKLYVTKIEVKDSVNFSLVSDPINDVTYKAELRLQFPKGAAPDSAKSDQLAGEVFTIAPDNPNAGGAVPAAPTSAAPAATPAAPAAPEPPPPPQPELAPIAPPPPPPDAPAAPPPTVSLGMTIDQVVAIMGQPQKILDAGSKKIYSYQGLKITFVDGKVSDVQ